MPPSFFLHKVRDNPVIAEKRAKWVNLSAEIATRPALSALIGLLCLCLVALLSAALHALIVHHAATALGWLQHRAAGVWAAAFLLCLAVLVPPARRDAVEAESGWLSALPQMPRALHWWSRWRSFGLALLQVAFLFAGLVWVHRLAPGESELAALDWLPTVIVPVLAWLVVPLLARPRNPRSRGRPSHRRIQSKGVDREPRSVLARWQWVHYKSRRWTPGTRWTLGFVVLLMPAGISVVQVGVTLLVGVLFLQWLQLWSSSLQVVVRASALTAALPQRPWSFVAELSRLPLLVAASFAPFALALLAVTGLPLPAALVLALAGLGALTLHSATVLAWRHRPRFLGLRSLTVVLVWVTLSLAVPFGAPLLWLCLIAWLLRLAGKAAP